MVDAEDRRLGEDAVQGLVERARRGRVVAEGLLDDDARVLGAARCPERLDDDAEEARGNRQVVHGTRGGAELLLERPEGRRVVVVAVHVAEERQQLGELRLVDAAAVVHEAVAGPGAELLQVPARLRDPDHRHVEVTAPDQGHEGREDLLVGEVARRAEEDQRVRSRGGHGR